MIRFAWFALALPVLLASAWSNAAEELAALPLELPKPVVIGTRLDKGPAVKLDPQAKDERPLFMAPKGVTNVAREKPVAASDKEPLIGEIKQVTDGDKDGCSGSYVEFGPGLQWVQVDLGSPHEVFAIVAWFYHGDWRVYHDVIVQVSSDADFISDVQTLFNNDYDNTAGMGVGNDFEFLESYRGKLIDGRKEGKPVTARYVRIYTKGSTTDETNRFTEIEVWGRPAK